MNTNEGKWVAKSIDGKERRFTSFDDAEAWKKTDTRLNKKEKPMSFRQYMDWKEKEAATARDEAKPKANIIWDKFQTAVGDSFPDGDPFDRISHWLNQNSLTMDDVNAAVREYSDSKDAYDYLQKMWDDYAADAEHDAMMGAHGDTYDDQWFQRPNPWK